MSLATAGIHCTISQRLSGVIEDCSIVRGRQLRMLGRRRCCVSSSRLTTHVWLAVECSRRSRTSATRHIMYHIIIPHIEMRACYWSKLHHMTYTKLQIAIVPPPSHETLVPSQIFKLFMYFNTALINNSC